MEDLALLSLLETLKPSPSSFLASVVTDACGGEVLLSTSTSTFSLADPSIPLASLIRVTRSIFVDALSRSATEPSFSERLIKAGVSSTSASLLSNALFNHNNSGKVARNALIHSAGGGGGASRLIDFDWTAKATLASSALQGPKAQAAVLALTLRTQASDSTPSSTTTTTTVLELSRNELNAMIEELEAVHDSMNSI